MWNFFKTFFAALLAMVVFTVILLFFLVAWVGNLASSGKPKIEEKSVLVIDVGQHYEEQVQENLFGALTGDEEKNIPSLYDVVRLIDKAASDEKIAGIYIQCNPSPNGFSASDEIRTALLEYKKSKKFLYAFGDVITQKAYHIANTADKIYLSPQGYMEWNGFAVTLTFLKGTLDKLNIQPQIFYAGKFKSATEPLRTTEMTPENELQTSVWLGDLYDHFLLKASEARKIDTAELRKIANDGRIVTAQDAVDAKLVDALKYDDEVKDEIKSKLGLDKYQKINFVSINTYAAAGGFRKTAGEKIAIIYAEGDIIDGKSSQQGTIAADDYRKLIRRIRLDKSIKAIVFRINSGGGSSLASETIWRELELAKKDKPVVISFGDVAASGGYYIACAADSIFANPTTITGSIGVFGIIPNMEGFFKNKLGVTFDGVKTGPYGDAGTMTRPMNENEKKIVQAEIENIYAVFKKRVADARKKDVVYIDSIAQGRVWTGQRAIQIGLIDKFGGINDAVAAAARMAKLPEYYLREYPESVDFLDQLLGKTSSPMNYNNKLKEELGEENFRIFNEMRKVQQISGKAQAKLPFNFSIN
ncbi:MAG: signal peptide peptidase SppA [Bacteroidetes bacterium]|nr:MAG: signal peptide peptidase SppA [Bacteroidota bacterium]